MNDQLIDVRTPLAVSSNARVEIGRDGVIHVLAGPVTLHLERAMCEELTTTLARAMVMLSVARPKVTTPTLVLLEGGAESASERER